MLLSHTQNQFEHVTLLVRADHQHAELWLGHELELERVGEVTRPEAFAYDRRSGSLDEERPSTATDEIDHEYILLLKQAIEKYVAEHQAQYLWLVMSAELVHQLQQKLSPELQGKITRSLHLDLMKMDMQEVVERASAEGSTLA